MCQGSCHCSGCLSNRGKEPGSANIPQQLREEGKENEKVKRRGEGVGG